MTLILHEHPFAAWCWKALIALDELGLPFERGHASDSARRAQLTRRARGWRVGTGTAANEPTRAPHGDAAFVVTLTGKVIGIDHVSGSHRGH
jgi:hypothetical protein